MPKFLKRIVRPGTYTIPRSDGTKSRVYIGKERMERWIGTFKAMSKRGLQIPAPWRHEEKATPVRLDGDKKDTDAYNNAGFWSDLKIGDDGWLWGELDAPLKEDAERIGKTVQDVSLLAKPKWLDGSGNEYDDAITHIALVTHPVAKDSKNFVPTEPAIALSFDNLLMAGEDISNSQNSDSDPAESVTASDAGVKDALKMLTEVSKIVLPDDTNAENFLERLITALAAIRGTETDENNDGESVREPPAKSKTQPGPVAMSKELDLALAFMANAHITNPATKQSYTDKELILLAKEDHAATVTTKLSSEDQATINWARNQVVGGYKSRIEKCVESGRVDPKTAKEFWDKLSADQDLRFSFDEEGKPVKNQYDWILSTWEKAPAHGALTNHSPTSAKTTRANLFGDHVFSLAAGVSEEQPPESADLEPMTDAQVNDVLAVQFASAGKRNSQIEGGLPVLQNQS